MHRTTGMAIGAFVSCLALATAMGAARAQTLQVDQVFGGDVVVTGQAAAGSGPITIYDTSFEAAAPLGREDSMDDSGHYAVSVDPPLISGHVILAEDAAGNQSTPVTVVDPPDPTVPQ